MSTFRSDPAGTNRSLDALFSGGSASTGSARGGAGGGGRLSRRPLMNDYADRVRDLARRYVLIGYERTEDDRPENERDPGTLQDSIRVHLEDTGRTFEMTVSAREIVTWDGQRYDVAEIIHQGHRAFSSRKTFRDEKTGAIKKTPLRFQRRGASKMMTALSVPAVREYPFLWKALEEANKEFLRDRGFGFILRRGERGVLEGDPPSLARF